MAPDAASLAYVFWHWRRPSIAHDAYEARLRAFHATLAERRPAGFARSTSAALSGAPWANAGGPAYEDRYLIADASGLDTLDAAVADGALQPAHGAAAEGLAGGTAGLYRARLGIPLAAAAWASWFAKPAGTNYDELLAAMAPHARVGAGVLWVRRLVLGPTPELCLESTTPVSLPPHLDALVLALQPVWPG